jgi:ligand-binding sensor domain-containing protein/signal transduction histidine kinase
MPQRYRKLPQIGYPPSPENPYLFAVKRFGRRISPLLFWCMGSAMAQPHTGKLHFNQLSVKNGMSSNLVHCLLQDSQGFVWIGTANGLNRYDGIGFKQVMQQTGLPGNDINNLAEAPNGERWIGTSQGAARLNPFTNSVAHYFLGSDCYVFVDKKGTVWITSGSQLNRFDAASNSFAHYPVNLGQQLNITRNFNIASPFEDSRGRFWLPTSYGVQRFDRQTGQFKSWRFPEQGKAIGENAITAIEEGSDGYIYAATWGAGLLRWDSAADRFDPIRLAQPPGAPTAVSVNIVRQLLPDGDRLWLATDNGLVQTTWQALRPGSPVANYTLYTHQNSDDRSLGGSYLQCLLKDRAGNIWCGGQGISWFNPAQQVFATLRNLSHKGKPFAPTAFVADRFGNPNNYLFGTYDLYGVDQPPGTLHPYRFEQAMYNKDFGSVVWDIAAGKNGYWLATTNGLLQLDANKRLVKKYPGRIDGEGTLPGERLWKVMEDSRGWVWAATVRHGIGLVNPATGNIQSFFHKKEMPNSLFNQYTSAFLEDRQGNVWTGANGKLYCWQVATGRFAVYPLKGFGNQQPRPLAQHPDGWIWLVSDKGLHRFNPVGQQLLAVAQHPELTGGDCATVDQQGHIWVGTHNGLFRFDTAAKQLKKFTAQNGLESGDNFNALYTMPNGDLLLGGDGYITRFNPQRLRGNSFVPPVVITRIQVNGRDSSLAPNGTFRLPYHSSIGFEFAALNFANAEKNQYQYRLEGIDNNWIPANGQRNVLYGELPPGRYVFWVKGSNDDGLWNETPASFAFMIPTPWYRSAWFIVPALLLLAALLYAAYRYRLRQLLAMERLRTRIATDLHDDIGATLSSISMYSEAVKNQLKGQNPQLENVLHKMGESSRDMVTSMSDIVWAINPGNDDGAKLVKRMESYAADLCAVRGIQLHFAADEKAAAWQLPLEHRKNIYLIFKESVNNAVKYAGAANIWVQLARQGKTISLTVKDDGKGLQPRNGKAGQWPEKPSVKGRRNRRAVNGNGQRRERGRSGAGCLMFCCLMFNVPCSMFGCSMFHVQCLVVRCCGLCAVSSMYHSMFTNDFFGPSGCIAWHRHWRRSVQMRVFMASLPTIPCHGV